MRYPILTARTNKSPANITWITVIPEKHSVPEIILFVIPPVVLESQLKKVMQQSVLNIQNTE